MDWHRALAEAGDADTVLEVVNDYLQAMGEDERARIPAGECPRRVGSIGELHERQRRLTAQFAALPVALVDIALQDLCVLLLRASVRARQLELAQDAANAAGTLRLVDTGGSLRRSG